MITFNLHWFLKVPYLSKHLSGLTLIEQSVEANVAGVDRSLFASLVNVGFLINHFSSYPDDKCQFLGMTCEKASG